MSRAVYIGGFANGNQTAERVAQTLREYYGDVDAFSFSYAMTNPDIIRRAASNVDTVTHSAGMLAVVAANAKPKEISSFCPPLPVRLLDYPAKTLNKRRRMHQQDVGIISPKKDTAAVKAYEAGTAAELLQHPYGNFRHLPKISRFDAVDAAIDLKKDGVATTLAYTTGDEYFQLSKEREYSARIAGVHVLHMVGVHDELPLRPEAMFELFYTDTLGID